MFSNKLPLPGKNILVGGGSEGLGLSLSCILAQRGAHVTIVSRSQHKLDAALIEIEKHRQDTSQRFHAISADLSTPDASTNVFESYSKVNAGVACPDYVFCCQGGAGQILGYFKDLPPERFQQGWMQNYETTLWMTRAACQRMVQHGVKGKIIMVSSIMGLMGMTGYSAYGPAKAALRALADCLRNEFILYGIGVHIFFPGTIFSPGYAEETKVKPALTTAIEGPEEGMKPEVWAARLISGLEKGQFMITAEPIGHIFRNAMKGLSPGSHLWFDWFWSISATVGLPIWRRIADRQVATWDMSKETQKKD